MSGQPYLASEDSAFLRDALRPYAGQTCLEIGTGNAGNLIELAQRFRTVVGTDLVRPLMADWMAKGANFVLADGSSCLRDSCVDLVAFNPPYLREEGTGDRTVEGGVELEAPRRFLEDALRVVKQEGKIVLLLNGDADLEKFWPLCARRGFGLKRLATRHLFFEELSAYEASEVPATR
jgi:methylase of polypeptide subunit release factors